MASARSLANQKLYHARILANAWRAELAAQGVPATVLAGAFDEPSRAHLREAYGWFLLEILQSDPLPDSPPANCQALPDIAPGKVLPGEIRELAQLERDGWLGEMLRPAAAGAGTQAKSHGNLVTAVETPGGPDQVDTWIDALQELFNRMADSLDEY